MSRMLYKLFILEYKSNRNIEKIIKIKIDHQKHKLLPAS